MITFVLLALLAGIIAAAFATSPLWRTQRRLAISIVVGLLLAGAGLYRLEGEPLALDPANVAQPKTIPEAIAQLQRRLDADPDNFEGRVLLARSYMAEQKFELARDNYAIATATHPEDTDLSVEYAEALLHTAPDHHFPPAAVAMLENAVAKNSQNQRALFFLGLQRMQAERPAEAAALWQQLLPLLPSDTGVALRQQIDAARLAAHLPALPPVVAPTALLHIRVSVAPALAQTVHAGAVLYVFARSSDGKGPPLAVQRITLEHLPIDVALSDVDSWMPTAKLSSQSQVIVMARLSLSGNASAASGDLEADPQDASVGKSDVITLNLSRVVP